MAKEFSPLKNILIICSDALNGWGGSTPRLLALATGFSSMGWHIALLAASHNVKWTREKPEFIFPGKIFRTPMGRIGEPLWMNRKGFRRMWRYWNRMVYGSSSIAPAGKRAWAARALEFYSRDIREFNPGVIWGISCGELTAVAAAYLLASQLQIPWVLEFQDPCPSPGYSLDDASKKLMKDALHSSSQIVTTTKAFSEELSKHYPAVTDKLRTYYLTFDDSLPLPEPSERDDTQLHLLHMGHLHGGPGRNARTLVQSIARLVKRSPDVGNRINLRLVGRGNGVEEAIELAKELDIADRISREYQVTLSESIDEMNRADVLVLIKFPGEKHNMQIPGKAFQYLGRGKPILGIMGDCEAAHIIKRS
ncbi:hypothetical protein JW979_09810, partial [bacterium]|nr:hypothetical protein [candidate division CSSED10-310 bacterium]